MIVVLPKISTFVSLKSVTFFPSYLPFYLHNHVNYLYQIFVVNNYLSQKTLDRVAPRRVVTGVCARSARAALVQDLHLQQRGAVCAKNSGAGRGWATWALDVEATLTQKVRVL